MCGITGIWNLNGTKPDKAALVRFTDTLSHRGPDGSGYYLDDDAGLGFGHRRLSILDLSENGKQPMSYGDERYWITYNGEVFNFIELQNELKQKGYSFKSNSDTEIILAAYVCWGKDCLLKFNGMWALAIWDRQEKSLFLSRDRFGIKPLYYLYLPGKLFAFASETTAFKNLNGFQRKVDQTNLARVIDNNLALIGHGYTVFENIFQLLSGHYMLFTQNQIPKQKRWWSTLEHRVKVPASYQEQVEQFSDIFEDACRIQMRSDVPIASALSGGVDSSAVNCMINHMMQGSKDKSRIPDDWRHAFFSHFKGTDQDEKNYADEVIKYINCKATYIETDFNQMLSDIERSTIDFDDVSGSPLIYLSDTYKAMNKAGIKVSLDGHGPDEMLLGYPFMVREAYRWAQNEHKTQFAGDIADTYVGMFREELKAGALAEIRGIKGAGISQRILRTLLPSAIKDYLRPNERVGFKNPWLKIAAPKGLPSLSDKPENLYSLNETDRSFYNEFHSGMLQGILRDFDRASMQSHVEIRMPFLDWRLVTYIFSLPLESRIGNGFTKKILRDSMKGKMPENIRTRKLKMGFSAPLVYFFNDGMKQYVMDKLSSDKFLKSELWDGPAIQKTAMDHFKNNSWQWSDCSEIWKFINASLID